MKTGKIYKIEVDGELVYIGSTTNLRIRKSDHKSRCFNENAIRHNLLLYKTIRSKGVTKETFKNRVKLIWICDVEFNKRYELGAVEAHYIKKLQPICNCEIPWGKKWNKKQYYQDNKKFRKQYDKNYYLNNKDKIKERKKKYNKSDKSKKICLFCKQKYTKTPSDFYKHTRTNKHKKNCISFIDDVIDTKECRLISI